MVNAPATGDRAITQDFKTMQNNCSTAWIDYKEVYDSMPHTIILECLALYKTNKALTRFIKNSA